MGADVFTSAGNDESSLHPELDTLGKGQWVLPRANSGEMRDEEIAVDVACLVIDDLVDAIELLLLKLANSQVLDLCESPAVREMEDDRPVVNLCIVKRISSGLKIDTIQSLVQRDRALNVYSRVVEDPKEAFEIFRSYVLQHQRVSIAGPLSS